MAEQEIDQLRDDAARQRQAIAQDLEYVGDRVSPGRIVDRRKAAMSQRMGSVRNSVFGSPDPKGQPAQSPPSPSDSSLQSKAGDAIETLKDRTPDSVTGFAEGNPLAAGLIGLGLGLLAATLLPESREEQRIAETAQDGLDGLAEELAHSGRDAVDNLKPVAQEAVDEVKGSAQDSAGSIKDEAASVAQDVKGEFDDQRDRIQN